MNHWNPRNPPFPPSKPRRVDGGIKARTKIGSIGKRWWSRRFIDVLESIADRGRLARGRAYARQGQVASLTVAAYEVTAAVQGSRAEPYQVSIAIDEIDDETWDSIAGELASQAVYRARLLAGEMPPEIEDVFVDHDRPLFPQDPSELRLHCSCPDWGWPCKHVAAALYVLAEAFDDDPFLVLAWNGRTREQLLAALRAHDPGPEASGPAGLAGLAGLLAVEEAPLEDVVDSYWTPAGSLARLADREPVPDAPADLLLRILDPPRVKVRGKPLPDVLRPAYERLRDDG